jgi:hypothetical protein
LEGLPAVVQVLISLAPNLNVGGLEMAVLMALRVDVSLHLCVLVVEQAGLQAQVSVEAMYCTLL